MFALAQRGQEVRISSYKRRRSSCRREETAISGDRYSMLLTVLDKHINEALIAERSTPYSVLRTMIDTGKEPRTEQ